MRSGVLMTAAAIVVAAACNNSTYGGGGGPGGGGRSTTITVGNNVFSPTPDTVAPGQVTFSWSTPSNGHTVTWDSGPGTLPSSTSTMTSGTYVATLVAGTYQYHCAIHGGPGTGMRGTIVVQ